MLPDECETEAKNSLSYYKVNFKSKFRKRCPKSNYGHVLENCVVLLQ
jgi:hypothetical protein